MYLAYTYLITNKITNQFYYGSRCRNIKLRRHPEEDFWIKYFTSSKKVKTLINEHGKDSFEISIIMRDEDYDKCYLYEQELIAEHLGKSLCLNGHCTKTGKFSTAGTITSEKTKAKLSAAHKGKRHSPEHTENSKSQYRTKTFRRNTF